MSARDLARRLAAEHVGRGDATGWFESLYGVAAGDATEVPWADLTPNPTLVRWLKEARPAAAGRRALVVGSGLGDDAELLAAYGYSVLAFDIAPTAVQWSRRRFPASPVDYAAHDLLAAPQAWGAAFDLVFEAYTLQVLPTTALRAAAIFRIASFVGPDGLACIVARGRDEGEPEGQMPWPLTRAEMSAFGRCGLVEVQFRDFLDDEVPPVRRFFGLYRG